MQLDKLNRDEENLFIIKTEEDLLNSPFRLVVVDNVLYIVIADDVSAGYQYRSYLIDDHFRNDADLDGKSGFVFQGRNETIKLYTTKLNYGWDPAAKLTNLLAFLAGEGHLYYSALENYKHLSDETFKIPTPLAISHKAYTNMVGPIHKPSVFVCVNVYDNILHSSTVVLSMQGHTSIIHSSLNHNNQVNNIPLEQHNACLNDFGIYMSVSSIPDQPTYSNIIIINGIAARSKGVIDAYVHADLIRGVLI